LSDIDALQQQILEARRALILDAATRVFAEKGFHRATIKDIAHAAGIADGTIYNYFANKESLLSAILDRLAQQDTTPEANVQTDLRAFMAAYLRQRIALLWPNYEIFKAVLPELLVNQDLRDLYHQQILLPGMQQAEQFFTAQIDAGKLRRLDVAIVARAISAMLFGLFLFEMLGDEHLQIAWEDAPEMLASLLVDGLKPDRKPKP
jgi:AcrR family transcriptional regulator